MKTNLKHNLKALREIRDLTQQQIADAVNVSRSSYAYYESGGRFPSIETLTSLSKVYKTSIDALVNGELELRNNPPTYKTKEIITFDALDDDEQNLILKYRLLSDEKKKQLTEIADSYKNAKDK